MKKKYLLPEFGTKLEIVRKNLEFCTSKGCEHELKKGGKYFKNYEALISDATEWAMAELYIRLSYALPEVVMDCNEDVDFIKFSDEYLDMFEKITDPYKLVLKTVIKTGKHEKIIEVFSIAIKQYVTKYSEMLGKIA